ncbi:hypothetical protein VPDG_00140 [Vibrio phage henriette 12B8]|uniref:hypothetical protein n=1 Tax=Vibrio phage henriette 12B8 TaxID=573174 RepID=UPI0002C08142|nr:hypothetical protein VPDG_00140 [Vibrio phage henriette 12B8]AGG58301.1 hypothetical protein VPDG_00140 [Vibrio phage henriette 12B8]
MFTIKLYQDNNRYDVLYANHYMISKFLHDGNRVVEITLYKDFTTTNGVTYRVAKELPTPHFSYAYIENAAGKTIEKFIMC